MIYFAVTIYYVSVYAVEGIAAEDDGKLTVEFCLRFIIAISVIYFAFFEFLSMVRDGKEYLSDVFNYFDWFAFASNLWIISHMVRDEVVEDATDVTDELPSTELIDDLGGLDTVDGLVETLDDLAGEDDLATRMLKGGGGSDNSDGGLAGENDDAIMDSLPQDRQWIRALAAFSVFFMWIKTFYWMRLFTGTSFYIRLILETLSDIKYFLILTIFIFMTFGNTLLIMNQGRTEDGQLYSSIFGVGFLDVMLNNYITAIGDYEVDGFKQEGGDVIIWILFIMATFISQVTFLNMLIAIMGDTFDRVSEVKEQSALAEKINILADYVTIVRKSTVDLDKFLYAVTPA